MNPYDHSIRPYKDIKRRGIWHYRHKGIKGVVETSDGTALLTTNYELASECAYRTYIKHAGLFDAAGLNPNSMTASGYFEAIKPTITYKGQGEILGRMYTALGLCGEAGEAADKIKKNIRNNDGVITEEFKDGLKKEYGDILWYITVGAMEHGITLDEIMEANIKKLHGRMERGTLHGEGDNR